MNTKEYKIRKVNVNLSDFLNKNLTNGNGLASIVVILYLLCMGSCADTKSIIHVVCQSSNDMYGILQNIENIKVDKHDSPLAAVQQANDGEAVMVFADEYPDTRVEFSDEFFKIVKEKSLRVYLEYPSFLPGIALDETVNTKVERAVVNSSLFKSMPDSLNILNINGLYYIPAEVKKSHIVAARVAGFDYAVYGLPEKTSPILFELPGYNIMVSSTNLSRLITGRYAPQQSWAGVWKGILQYLLPEKSISIPEWTPIVNSAYGKSESLPGNYQLLSIENGIKWYHNSKMLIPAGYEKVIEKAFDPEHNTGMISWSDTIPEGDGSNGVFECIFSKIDENGNQPIGIVCRGDCNAETAMAFACAGKVLGKPENNKIADDILDYYLLESPALKKEYGDPKHGAYGLIPWGITSYGWYRASYGDDNARFLLSALTSASLTGADRWDETFMRSLLALLRTTGKNGFRGSRIDLPDFEKNGWKYYYDRNITNISPHFEAYTWACMLWAYDKTGDSLFLERTEKAIHTTMNNYPDGWRWTNGSAQEKARMILPLSWLVRVNNSAKNRDMLLLVINDLVKLQDESGALREEIGDLKMGRYPPPQSNEKYGTNEASLIAKNGDKVSDLLYTSNFAFLGLHEAYYATMDPKIKKACDKLSEFLCRIQVVSQSHPEIDGGWMRAFDFGRYEHWGSNADLGWGAWAIESGWTQGWIVSILALRELDTSIWDLTKDSKVNYFYNLLKEQMLQSPVLQ